MSFSGGEYPSRRGLLGVDDSGIGITRQAEAVGAHDWPTGFVFHILPDSGNREFENCFSTAVTVGERRVPDGNPGVKSRIIADADSRPGPAPIRPSSDSGRCNIKSLETRVQHTTLLGSQWSIWRRRVACCEWKAKHIHLVLQSQRTDFFQPYVADGRSDIDSYWERRQRSIDVGNMVGARISAFGLVIAKRPEGGRYRVDGNYTYRVVPHTPSLEAVVWESETALCGMPIWSQRDMWLWYSTSVFSRREKVCRATGRSLTHDLIPHSALIWGQTADELRALRRVTVYAVDGPWVDDKGGIREREVEIFGMRVDFSPESGIARRTIGTAENPTTGGEWGPEFTRSFDIQGGGTDGQKEERIDEIISFHTRDGDREMTRGIAVRSLPPFTSGIL
jgi:hypothetical protein